MRVSTLDPPLELVQEMNSDTLDDAQVALRGIPQSGECRLVAGAVVGSNRLCERVELDKYGTLIDAGFVSLGGVAASEEAAASSENTRARGREKRRAGRNRAPLCPFSLTGSDAHLERQGKPR